MPADYDTDGLSEDIRLIAGYKEYIATKLPKYINTEKVHWRDSKAGQDITVCSKKGIKRTDKLANENWITYACRERIVAGTDVFKRMRKINEDEQLNCIITNLLGEIPLIEPRQKYYTPRISRYLLLNLRWVTKPL